MPHRHIVFTATLLVALTGAAVQPALAADTPPTTAAAPDKLAAARQAIQAKDWKGAIQELERVNDRTGSTPRPRYKQKPQIFLTKDLRLFRFRAFPK